MPIIPSFRRVSAVPHAPPPYDEVVPPAQVLEPLDREYPLDRLDKHFTISCVILNTRDGMVQYSNAGHPPPVLLHTDGTMGLF